MAKFKLKVGDVIRNDKQDLIIVDTEIRNMSGINYNYYKCKCNKDNHEWWVRESNLIRNKRSCPVCANKIAVLGINTIWDTDRWMVTLGVSEEDAKSNVRGSGKKIKVICPNCKSDKYMQILSINQRKSIACKKCGDGLKYPEKFMMGVLNQLGVKYITQLTKKDFKWIGDKRYDFYIPSLNMIIETHGEQHYKECPNFKMTLEEQQENDRYKHELALSNNIENYIVVNCSKSEFDWMTFNVYKELKDYFDMTNIDFAQAEGFALSNVVKEVCEYWNNKEEWETVTQLIGKFNLSRNTVIEYLKKGTERGWCNYDSDFEKRRYNPNSKRKGVEIDVYKNGEKINDISFESIKQLCEKSIELYGVKFTLSCICEVCEGKRKTHKGFTFKYATETTEQNNLKESA